jgi:polysaccharide export outer membrane protein
MSARTIRRTYKIREADQLEIIYFVRTFQKEETYPLKIRDVISVRFPFNKDLNVDEAEVQSDGTVHLPLLNSVQVFGKSLEEVQAILSREYAKYLRRPVLTVSLKKSKQEIDDLREAITTSPRGQSRLVPVTPDGTIAVPLVGSVLAAGKTVDAVKEDLTQRYRDLNLKELEVTVNLQTIAPLRVYVMGEVARPGLVLNDTGTISGTTQLSLMQAIAQAGSYDPKRAELSKVLLVRYKNVASPQVAVVNLHQMLINQTDRIGENDEPFTPDGAEFRRDIWLEDGDVIYVPTKAIAQRADYIEYVWTRGIYAVVPITYTIQATYSAVDNVDWLGPDR